MANASQPSLGSTHAKDEETHAELATEVKVASWMKQRVTSEIEKFKSQGANAIPMQVSNMCIVREENAVINRVELPTKFNFDLIKEIHHSDPIDCPYKEGYAYVNVLLFTDKPLPIIIPYLYQPEATNTLKDWVFINEDNIRVRHRVGAFVSK